MSSLLEPDRWYWLPDEERLVVPAKLVSYGGGSAKFVLEDGTEVVQRIKADASLELLDTQCLDKDISNLISLKTLSDNAVLHILRNRFYQNNIYTLVSSILIACNPFKQMDIYDRETMDNYRRTRDHSSLPPHIFSLANQAYTSMLQTGTPQSVVISGESGAGKTESIKLILKYLARLSEITSQASRSVQDQILSANPLLEAFGNAKTSRNNNSSRFGKLITVNFSSGVINQASIISYLLEKSRVVHQQMGERNYHIFYQVLAACTDDPKFGNANGLQDSTGKYTYLSDPESNYLYNVNELESFREVEESMNTLGIDKAKRSKIFKVVACVLRLGNIHFNESPTADGRALIDDIPELERICDTLGLKQSEMKRCLVSRNFGIRSIVTCFFSVQQAKDTRDAFAKALYANLFNWLIKTVNFTLSSAGNSLHTGQFIALLDIFGFEKFESNSFEQLLINYCNEKLQYHFNNHIFVMEQEAYKLEGIGVNCISFKDNSATLAVIEEKTQGLLAMLDEEINIPKGSDESLLSKLFTRHGGSSFISRAKPSAKNSRNGKGGNNAHLSCFVIRHYAGEVSYDITGFLEKNKDSLPQDLMYLGKNSTDAFVAEIFQQNAETNKIEKSTPGRPAPRTTPKSKGPTIATQFKKQLLDLIATLNSTSPFFVRCMKTNPDKVSDVFEPKMMLKQLQYSGLLEVCRIRQDGYPCRFDFNVFYHLFWKLHPASTDGCSLAKDLEAKRLYGPGDYCIGRNKVFLKYATGQKLECMRGDSIQGAASSIQRLSKVFLCRRRLRKVLHYCKDGIDVAIKARDKSSLERAVAVGKLYLPLEGMHIAKIKEAKSSLDRLEEEDKVIQLLSDALNTMDFTGMEHAVSCARAMKPMLASPLLRKCEVALKDFMKERDKDIGSKADHDKGSQDKGGRAAEQDVGSKDDTSSSTINNPLPPPSPPPPPPPSSQRDSNPVVSKPVELPKHTSESSGGMWASPSEIKAAKGKNLPPGVNSTASSHSPKKLPEAASHSSKRVNDKPSTTSNTGSSPQNGNEAEPYSQNKADDDQIVDPKADYKSRRKTVLKRQLSATEINVADEIHRLIQDLNEQSISEVGLVVDDIRPLEIMLKKISIRDNPEDDDVAHLMMAEEELVRAKKQLLLQAAVDKVKSNAPLWKLKNLAHQARQIGMENYEGVQKVLGYLGE